jgi:hypothetical protein
MMLERQLPAITGGAKSWSEQDGYGNEKLALWHLPGPRAHRCLHQQARRKMPGQMVTDHSSAGYWLLEAGG